MKVLSRDFTLKEKILLLVLSLFLVGLAYYQFVDQPVRRTLESARAEADSLRLELKTVESQLALMRRMRDELEDVTAGGSSTEMGSYNNSKAEIAMLNDILEDTLQYSISFADVTRVENQIRRNFTLQFKVEDYDDVERVIRELTASQYRCLIGDLKVSAGREGNVMEGNVTVNATATFFETMVGGTPDAGLPASKPTAK
jgi:General secretion pathway, M protein.